MLKRLRGIFSEDLCVDLGTANTLIFARGKGIVLNESSVIAVREDPGGTKSIVAVGDDARQMLGRTPDRITTIRPLKDGVIADFTVTEKMLQHFIRKAHKNRILSPSPRILMATPCGSTAVERRALREAAIGAGAREVHLMIEPLLAAIGANMPVSEAFGSMVVDIGGGTTEVAVISLDGIVYSESLRVGGFRLDQAIIQYVRRNYGMVIGEVTAERVKHTIGGAYPGDKIMEMEIWGHKLSEGVPRSFVINSNEVLEALQNPLGMMVAGVMKALERVPPELGSDLVERGMVLTGGGALLRGLGRLLMNESRIPVVVADDPLTCVARSGGKVLDMAKGRKADMFATE